MLKAPYSSYTSLSTHSRILQAMNIFKVDEYCPSGTPGLRLFMRQQARVTPKFADFQGSEGLGILEQIVILIPSAEPRCWTQKSASWGKLAFCSTSIAACKKTAGAPGFCTRKELATVHPSLGGRCTHWRKNAQFAGQRNDWGLIFVRRPLSALQ